MLPKLLLLVVVASMLILSTLSSHVQSASSNDEPGVVVVGDGTCKNVTSKYCSLGYPVPADLDLDQQETTMKQAIEGAKAIGASSACVRAVRDFGCAFQYRECSSEFPSGKLVCANMCEAAVKACPFLQGQVQCTDPEYYDVTNTNCTSYTGSADRMRSFTAGVSLTVLLATIVSIVL